MSLNQQIEKQLLIALRRIDAPYREALSILDEASAAEAVNPLSVSEHLKISQRLQPSMKIITACEQQLAPLRQRWHDSGQSPSQELQEILTRQTDLLKRLIERLNTAETNMTSSQSQLGLKLEQSQKHVVAHKAYQSESA